MKTKMKLTILVYVLAILVASASAQTVKCPPEGGPQQGGKPLSEKEKIFNTRKNKSAKEPRIKPLKLTINDLLQGTKPVKDSASFKEGTYVELSGGYLMSFEEKGPESCNCHLADATKGTGDVHINLCTRDNLQAADNNYSLIVEITPSYKALHPQYTDLLKSLKGTKVVVRGYLFYDYEHKQNSVNYCTKCEGKSVWRKTCWEIHPITYIAGSK